MFGLITRIIYGKLYAAGLLLLNKPAFPGKTVPYRASC